MQDYCLPKCPSYHVVSLKKQEDDPSKFVAIFSVEKVTYPIGKLHYQTLRLDSKEASDDSHWSYLTANDFDQRTKRSQVTIKNLLRHVTYFPIYEFHLSLDLNEMRNLTKIAWECKGTVRLFKKE